MSELEDISMALMGQQFGGPGRDPATVTEPARDMYDAGILYTDELLRRVVEAVRERGTLDETVLVVLADHGEVLGEWGDFFGHGASLYQESVSVPLIVRYPPAIPSGTRVETPVSTVGVFGTILELAGIEAPPTLQVGSLVPIAKGLSDTAGPIIAETMRPEALGGAERDMGDPLMYGNRRYRAFRSEGWKLVETSESEAFLFDLRSPAGETRDVAQSQPRQLASLQAALASARADLGLPSLDAVEVGEAAPELDEATRERLRQLGYLE
jgi:arylsulfatase A-like enzyme